MSDKDTMPEALPSDDQPDWLPSGPQCEFTGKVKPPKGWLKFVKRRPDMDPRGHPFWKVRLTVGRARELSQAQNYNVSVTYKADGEDDHWKVATTEGDCEDIALTKLAYLLGLGWPRGALRMAVLHFWDTTQSTWQAHAVLIVLTDRGPMILDNLKTRWAPMAHFIGYYWYGVEPYRGSEWTKIRLRPPEVETD